MGGSRGACRTDDSEIPVDFVIVGTGIRPDTRPGGERGDHLRQRHTVVDDMGKRRRKGVWSAGDCANFPYKGGRLRLESVQNAIDQAEAVAANMLGAGKPYLPYPWFWSDQYDMKLADCGA